MNKKLNEIINEIDAAENTSSFQPAKQIKHFKNALDGTTQLFSEMIARIDALESRGRHD